MQEVQNAEEDTRGYDAVLPFSANTTPPIPEALVAELQPRRPKWSSGGEEDSVGWYVRQINCIPLLSLAQEQELARRAKAGDQEARQRLIEANLRLVVKLARRYTQSHWKLLDLIQEGNEGLIHAAQVFDPDAGCRFSTYAYWWVFAQIQRAIKEGPCVHLPAYMYQERQKVRQQQESFVQTHRREPTPEELAQITGVPVERDRLFRQFSSAPASLDHLMYGEDEDMALEGMLPDTEELVEDQVTHAELREALRLILRGLVTEREYKVVCWHYGLTDDQQECSFELIAGRLGVSNQRASQILRAALWKLRCSSLFQQFYEDLYDR
jgi:RNA polymerase primary sigma factor